MNPSVVFYDVPAEAWAAQIFKLAAAAHDRGRVKLLIVVADQERAAQLDDALWTHRQEAFLPHEALVAGQELRDPDTRILIVVEETNPIGATLLIADRPVDLDFAARFHVVMDCVDRRSSELTTASRERFRQWKARGVTPDHRKPRA